MYTIDDLNLRLLSELKDIAEEIGVKNAKKLGKQDLIYKILDLQALKGEPVVAKPVSQNEGQDRKMRPRRRENATPTAPAVPTAAVPDKELSSDELLQSI